jgi:hypothetical protein
MVEKNGEIERNGRQDADSHNEDILVNAKNENHRRGQDVFDGVEIHIPMTDEEVHQGIHLLGSGFYMDDRKVGIENGEQDDEEKSSEEFVAVAVNTQMDFPIRLSPDGLTAPRKHVPAERPCWPLPPIPKHSPSII